MFHTGTRVRRQPGKSLPKKLNKKKKYKDKRERKIGYRAKKKKKNRKGACDEIVIEMETF